MREKRVMSRQTHSPLRIIVFGYIAAACLLCAVSSASARDVIVLGTATPGGGFPAYGAALAEVLGRVDGSLEIQQRNTKGSTENVSLLEAGSLDVALVQGEVAYEAFGRLKDPDKRIRIIAAMYSTAGMFVVSGDSPYRSIQDLKGLPVVFGAKGSGLVLLAHRVLNGMGLNPDRDFRAIYLDRAGDGPQMVQDGRAAALWGGGIGWPNFVTLAGSARGARFLVPDSEEIVRILASGGFLQRLTVPAGSYPGQETSLTSVGSWSFILARPDLPDSVAYCLARALHLSGPALAARLPQARETTPENTLSAAPGHDFIHPGVLRYLREIGLIQ